MKKRFCIFLSLIFLLTSACSPQATQSSPSATVAAVHIPTATQTSEPIPSQTIAPTSTEILSTPTLDVAKILTFTPAPYPECPPIDQNLSFSKLGKLINNPDTKEEEIKRTVTDFLNSGGTLKAVYEGLNKFSPDVKVLTIDVTNDKTPELILEANSSLFIFKCSHGKHEVIFERSFQQKEQPSNFELMYIKDINLNSIPEIIIKENAIVSNFDASFGCFAYYIYEWAGNQFKDLVSPEAVSFERKIDITKNTSKAYPSNGIFSCGTFVSVDETTHNKFEIKDTNQDNLAEIIIVSGVHVPEQFLGGLYSSPEKQAILTLSWNGQFYIPAKIEYKSVYRVHVALDGDTAFKGGDYEQALSFYQAAIDNTKLIDQPLPPQTELGQLDFAAGYKQVAAYAYYRMMLTKLTQNHPDEARLVYEKIQKKYSGDEVTKPFAEMAATFWNEYQQSSNPAHSCKKVVSYVTGHTEILDLFDFLGKNAYTAEDICPVH